MSEQAILFSEPFPILYVEDVERSARFYVDGFGFELSSRWPQEGALDYAYLRLNEGPGIGLTTIAAAEQVQARPLARAKMPSFELCIEAADVEVACARLVSLGARILTAPKDMPWGERIAYVEDPDGHPVHILQRLFPLAE
jgi:lactoylglutathione lyase